VASSHIDSTSLTNVLADYKEAADIWLEQCKKQASAVQKFCKAIENGNFKTMEKLRQSARSQAEKTSNEAENCKELDFDITLYLGDQENYLHELVSASRKVGVQLHERDRVIWCYPVMVVPDPESLALIINKKKIFELSPVKVASLLKKEQDKLPKTRTPQFLEALFKAYEFMRCQKKGAPYVSVPLMKLYRVLTILPGVARDYSPADFARDVYFLDIGECRETSRGFGWQLSASTSSREGASDVIKFVTIEGRSKLYHSIGFIPPET
jgi:hypothetical protein